jgi:hypothetical protein
VSAEDAAAAYGVVLGGDGVVDAMATEVARAKIASEFGDDRPATDYPEREPSFQPA